MQQTEAGAILRLPGTAADDIAGLNSAVVLVIAAEGG